MRFGYVLLGLVALTSVHTSSGQCSDGVMNGDICCAESCGTCGGGDCGKLPGGADNCCTSRIRDSGVMCSDTQGPPCIKVLDTMCDNGIPGVQSGNICCDASCGTCGGRGCARRPPGPNNCCTSRIRDSGVMCGAAPCIIADPTPAPTEMPTPAPTPAPVQMCSNDFPGIQSDNICCRLECGTCGGRGCGSLPGGAANCCQNTITANGVMCSTVTEAPCIIDP